MNREKIKRFTDYFIKNLDFNLEDLKLDNYFLLKKTTDRFTLCFTIDYTGTIVFSIKNNITNDYIFSADYDIEKMNLDDTYTFIKFSNFIYLFNEIFIKGE